ncbi:hypothetical protein KAR91_28965 [Candidatus Pacearchaeota archaeon]|nr:hypothetical protein [Candidatus Pacearchaeota archaeon]
MERSHDDIVNQFLLREEAALKKEAEIEKTIPAAPPGMPTGTKQIKVRISEFLNQVNIAFSMKVNSFTLSPDAAIQMAANIERVAKKIKTVPPVGVTKQ